MFTVTVIVSSLVPSVAVRITVHAFESVPVPQPGFSKSGALVNVRAPVPELILNKAESTDAPLSPTAIIEYASVGLESASVASYVPTA